VEAGTVRIRYRRLPDREQLFEQAVVVDAGDHVVTLLRAAALPRPVRAAGRVVLEPGAPVVWFTYRGDVWHDVGRFHLADGTFTGYYANVLTPVRMREGEWATTDLALDVWAGADGAVEVLDRDEFDEAVRRRWIDADTAARALAEAERLAAAAREGTWPPEHVRTWDLARAREHLARRPAPEGAPPSDHTQRENP
jgi:predicted RNA-binding protein associated with RNAse of E/G family